ncbi:hypothetical protein HY041_03780 [Candidatus Roizmanbacteria bacterium]|nr:hypothetical protein [Candidatus Roizmanbacteria bacterium]
MGGSPEANKVANYMAARAVTASPSSTQFERRIINNQLDRDNPGAKSGVIAGHMQAELPPDRLIRQIPQDVLNTEKYKRIQNKWLEKFMGPEGPTLLEDAHLVATVENAVFDEVLKQNGVSLDHYLRLAPEIKADIQEQIDNKIESFVDLWRTSHTTIAPPKGSSKERLKQYDRKIDKAEAQLTEKLSDMIEKGKTLEDPSKMATDVKVAEKKQ